MHAYHFLYVSGIDRTEAALAAGATTFLPFDQSHSIGRVVLVGDESLATLGSAYGLNTAAYHGHWRLCQFLIESVVLAGDGHTNGHSAFESARRMRLPREKRWAIPWSGTATV